MCENSPIILSGAGILCDTGVIDDLAMERIIIELLKVRKQRGGNIYGIVFFMVDNNPICH
jgi:hypothetical protein